MELVFGLCMLAMLEAADVNIAPGKPVSQSTTHSSFTAERGIDGDSNTYARTGSSDPSPYWQIDFQGSYDVTSVKIKIAFEPHYMSGVKIWLYDGDPTGTPQNTICATFPGFSSLVANTEYEYPCSASFPVKYLRLTRGGTTMCFREIQIFAVESTTSIPESTTQTPESTTQTPESTTQTPESTTQTPESTTQTPESTTQTPESTTPRQSSASSPVSRYDGVKDVTLTNVALRTSVTTVSECALACHSSQSCVAFSVTTTTSSDNCIHSSSQQTTGASEWRVYLKQADNDIGLDICTFIV